MKKYIVVIIFYLILISCGRNNDNTQIQQPAFWNKFDTCTFEKMAPGYNLVIKLAPYTKAAVNGYHIYCEIGDGSTFVPFSYFGFLFEKNNIIFTTPLLSNKEYKLFDLRQGQKFQQIIPAGRFDGIEIIKIGEVPPYVTDYKESIFIFKMKSMIPAYEGYNGDVVIFISMTYGPLGALFSVNIQDIERDLNTNIIYFIKGDVLLNKISFPNVVLGLNDRRSINIYDSLSCSSNPHTIDNCHLPDKDYYSFFRKSQQY